MTDTRRKAIRFVGFALIAAALCVIGYSAYDIISANFNTQDSLTEAEQLVGDANAYAGSADETPPPDAAYDTGVPQANGDSAADGQQTGPETGDATAAGGAGATGMPVASGANPTNKPAKSVDGSGGSSGNGSGGGPRSTPAKPTVIGMLVFNSLGGRKVPVLEGVTDKSLASGAAHQPSTSPPGGVGNCVIFGHRNTVFRGFGRLKVGDTIQLKVPGKTYTYAIQSMAVVEPDDARIWQSYGEAAMTLVTCYPFNYIGAAPHRYIVVAVLR